MLEDKIARKLDDLFSDNRINVYVLAAMTRRTVSPHAIDIISTWLDLHKAEEPTHRHSGQIAFDLGMFDIV